MPKKKIKLTQERVDAIAFEIFKKLMPNWEGAKMIIRFKEGDVTIPGGEIYKVIEKAVKKL